MKTMRIKQRFYDLIMSGKKTLEVRVGYDSINRIKSGEKIRLLTHTNSLGIQVEEIRRYESFEMMLQKESWKQIAPDSKSKDEVFTLFKQIYPKHKESLGVVVLEFVKI